MRLRLLLLPLFATLGCNAAQIDDRANQEIDMVHWRVNRDTIATACEGGAVYGPSCGLLADYVATPDFRAKFEAKECTTLDDASCNALLARSTDTWQKTRYWAADFSLVDRECAVGNACATPRARELLLVASHDANVSANAVHEVDAINEERAAEHAADLQRGLSIVGDAAELGNIVPDDDGPTGRHDRHAWGSSGSSGSSASRPRSSGHGGGGGGGHGGGGGGGGGGHHR